MYLFQNHLVATETFIRGVRYLTVSVYDGDISIFDKISGLIAQSFQSDEIDKITNESLVDNDMAIDEE